MCNQQNKLMSRFRRMSQTAKERYNQGIQFDPIEADPTFSPLYPQPCKSVTLPVSGNSPPVRVGTLVSGIQRADEEGSRLRDAMRSRKKVESKNVHLNLMKLQDKHFQISGNIYNIAVGEIIDKQQYLNKLNDQIMDLKSKIKLLQDDERSQMSKTIEIDKGPSSSIDRSRTIEGRRSLCGRIYSRMNTPSSERRYGTFRRKQPEASSYYKWKPELEDQNQSNGKQFRLLQHSRNPQEINRLSQTKDISSQRGYGHYRVKQKNFRQSTANNRQQNQNEGNPRLVGTKESKKIKTDQHLQTKTQQQSQKNEMNPELVEKAKEEQPYSGIIFQQQPQSSIKSINDDFRALITRQLQIPQNFPLGSPEIGLTIEQYEQVGRHIFQIFGVLVEREPTKMVTRRFKNGVYFQLGGNKNILWYFSGTFYLGGWDTNLPTEGQKNGYGFEYIPNKYVYLGGFKDGMKHGKGSIKILSGLSNNSQEFMAYQGEWVQGKPHGYGNHIDQKGTKYIGNFVAGEKTGSATILSKEGLLYEGEVQKGVKQGHGVEKLINGDTYMGAFEEGKFHGKGIYKWKNGSIYQGQFFKGKRQGKGKFTSANGDQFEGQYFQDLKNGWGKFTWANGQIYQGQFRNDIRHGQGTYKHPSGKIGKFLWKEGQIQERLYCKQEQEYRCRNLKKSVVQLVE